MNFRPYLLTISILSFCFLAACSKQEPAAVDLGGGENVIEIKPGEVRLDDVAFENNETPSAKQNSQVTTQLMSDNSEIMVMYDTYGNKLEKRYFKGDLKLSHVIVKTNADGTREVTVYGQSGERRTISGELANRLMNASAVEIAKAADITQTRRKDQFQTLMVNNRQSQPQQMPNVTTLPPVKLQTTPPQPLPPSEVEKTENPAVEEPVVKGQQSTENNFSSQNQLSERQSEEGMRTIKKGSEEFRIINPKN